MRCKVMTSQLATINSRMSDAINPLLRILALKFQLESSDGKILELIAWLEPDGNGKHLYPAHPDRTLMDVKDGDMLIFIQAKGSVDYQASEAVEDS